MKNVLLILAAIHKWQSPHCCALRFLKLTVIIYKSIKYQIRINGATKNSRIAGLLLLRFCLSLPPFIYQQDDIINIFCIHLYRISNWLLNPKFFIIWKKPTAPLVLIFKLMFAVYIMTAFLYPVMSTKVGETGSVKEVYSSKNLPTLFCT